MDESGKGCVALLIDFENLVYGVQDSSRFGIDPEPILGLCEEYGRVVLANAYADWRFAAVNQYQIELSRQGIDVVHVFGKGFGDRFKNAVDVKLAVDAVELVHSHPHIETFVIVSGDRDFIHLLKALRRHGRRVIGISPSSATSDDFAELCDRFVRYESLINAYETSPSTPMVAEHSLDDVRQALRAILAEYGGAILGSEIKPELRRRLSATFDENDLGFRRLIDMLYALPDTVAVETAPNGGAIWVRLAGTEAQPREVRPLVAPDIVEAAKLSEYRFQTDRERRRGVLRSLFEVMSQDQVRTKAEVLQEVVDRSEGQLSLTVLNKYSAVLHQARVLQADPENGGIPWARRPWRLRPDIQTAADLVFAYEASIVFKLLRAGEAIGHSPSLEEIGKILSVEPDEAERLVRRAQEFMNWDDGAE